MRPGLVVVCLLLAGGLSAQPLRIAEVLAGVDKDVRVRHSQELADLAASLRYHIPLLKEVEARIGIRGSVLGDTIYGYLRNEDIYALQIETNSFKEIKAQKNWRQAQINTLLAEKELYREEALLARYEVCAAWYHASRRQAAQNRLLELLQQKQQLLRISAAEGLDFSIKDAISVEEDLLDLQNKLAETANILEENQLRIRQFTGLADNMELDTAHFITADEIAAYLVQSGADASPTAAIQLRSSISDLSEAAYQNANAQNRQIFNSLRLNYDHPLYLERPSRFNTFNNFSIRLGLRIPLTGNNNFRSSRAMLEWREDELATQRTAEMLAAERDRQRLQLAQRIGAYRNYLDQEQQSLTARLLSDAALRPNLSAKELTDMEIIQQKLRLRHIAAAAELTQTYLQLLLLDGKMNAGERRNWLSRVGEEW